MAGEVLSNQQLKSRASLASITLVWAVGVEVNSCPALARLQSLPAAMWYLRHARAALADPRHNQWPCHSGSGHTRYPPSPADPTARPRMVVVRGQGYRAGVHTGLQTMPQVCRA